MEHYMVELRMPEKLGNDFILRIPAQRTHINKLMLKGLVTCYTMSENKSKLWVVIRAKTKESVLQVLKSMPLFPYLEAFIFETAIHKIVSHTHIHHLSMN